MPQCHKWGGLSLSLSFCLLSCCVVWWDKWLTGKKVDSLGSKFSSSAAAGNVNVKGVYYFDAWKSFFLYIYIYNLFCDLLDRKGVYTGYSFPLVSGMPNSSSHVATQLSFGFSDHPVRPRPLEFFFISVFILWIYI
jgi:hypothetical protein